MSAAEEWPSNIQQQSDSTSQPQPVDNEIPLNEHKQLDIADLGEEGLSLREKPVNTSSETLPTGAVVSEDVALEPSESLTISIDPPLDDPLQSNLLQDTSSVTSKLPPPMAPQVTRSESFGFDEVPSSAAGPSAGTPFMGQFSTPGSLIDIQPLEAAKPTVDTGPIPFFQQTASNFPPDMDFFAQLPAQGQAPHVSNTQPLSFSLTPASAPPGTASGIDFFPSLQQPQQVPSETNRQQPLQASLISPIDSSPSVTSPSNRSIISLETATISGQAPTAYTADSLGLPVPPPKAGFVTPTHHTGGFASFPTNFDIPLSRGQTLSQRHQPSPAIVEEKFQALPTRRWTDPTVFYDIPPRDPIGEIFPKAFPLDTGARPARKIVRVDDVSNEADPLLALVNANSWRSVAILARQRLLAMHPAEVKEIMRWWFVRLLALAKLKLFEFASGELTKVGCVDLDPPNLRYEKYPECFPDIKGSMLSFEIRMFWARLPGFKGAQQESISRFYRLLHMTRQMIRTCNFSGDGVAEMEPKHRWMAREAQIQIQIANLLIDLKDYRPASAILRALSVTRPDDPDLLSGLGRLYLQLGNMGAARSVFTRTADLIGRDPSLTKRPDLLLGNEAFLRMSEGDWERAVITLTQLLGLNPSSAVWVNNLALCQLYTGNVGQAVSFLDSIAIDMPRKAGVCEELLFNLCSLYDLTDLSIERKRKLLATVVSRSAGDDFDPACLKL